MAQHRYNLRSNPIGRPGSASSRPEIVPRPSSRLGLLRGRRRRNSNPYFRRRRPSNPFDDTDAPSAPPADLFERIPRFDLYGPHNCGRHVHRCSSSTFTVPDSSSSSSDDEGGLEMNVRRCSRCCALTQRAVVAARTAIDSSEYVRRGIYMDREQAMKLHEQHQREEEELRQAEEEETDTDDDGESCPRSTFFAAAASATQGDGEEDDDEQDDLRRSWDRSFQNTGFYRTARPIIVSSDSDSSSSSSSYSSSEDETAPTAADIRARRKQRRRAAARSRSRSPAQRPKFSQTIHTSLRRIFNPTTTPFAASTTPPPDFPKTVEGYMTSIMHRVSLTCCNQDMDLGRFASCLPPLVALEFWLTMQYLRDDPAQRRVCAWPDCGALIPSCCMWILLDRGWSHAEYRWHCVCCGGNSMPSSDGRRGMEVYWGPLGPQFPWFGEEWLCTERPVKVLLPAR
ncbi:hypothetical protein QBC47DRAFT_363623 [Echria macrotheca]|uniref:Uncharacterized protein n=1 Tax=Echria macrotheca TaxID=438768 RepID=A0AAJ0B5E8_9PEZI|nr:hypothetical protein QBC47DRAFT_363623 [Echria macrotheca]